MPFLHALSGQATGAVQTFFQRALMNLEPKVPPRIIDENDWKWLKNYRVWEANRKVFLYPENWMEREARTNPDYVDRLRETAKCLTGKGHKVTARQVKDRLDKELIGNVSLRVLPTERPDAWEVQGRGELALAILVEQMRREGFELTISRPEVIMRDGQEPYERATIDIPPDYIGVVQQALAGRKGRLEQMSTDTDGRVRMDNDVSGKTALILCGKGNNGGDGAALARALPRLADRLPRRRGRS